MKHDRLISSFIYIYLARLSFSVIFAWSCPKVKEKKNTLVSPSLCDAEINVSPTQSNKWCLFVIVSNQKNK